VSGGVVVALAVLLIPLLLWQAPRLAESLFSVRALPVMGLGVVFALLSLWAVLTRRFTVARVPAVAEVVVLLWGCALAQWPYIIYPDLTWEAAAAPDATLGFLMATAPLGAVLVVASL
jgi:cytochrome d ubiquinol oxidase subunit II